MAIFMSKFCCSALDILESEIGFSFVCRIEDTVLEAESAIDEEADDVRYAF